MNNVFRRISLLFMTGFCIFLEEIVCLEIVLKRKYTVLALGMWECTSAVEPSMIADQEVSGSILLAPFFIITVTCRKTLDV